LPGGHSSFWYKILNGTSFTFTVSLLDDSDCLSCNKTSDLEHYVSLDQDSAPGSKDWNEIRIEIHEDASGKRPFDVLFRMDQGSGNRKLDLDHIRGWWIGVSANHTASTVLLIDQLACVGGGDLLGAAFNTGDDLTVAEAIGSWISTFYDSNFSKNATTSVLDKGFLKLDYVVEQREPWGGYTSYEHVAPANAYYNLSAVDTVSFSYDVTKKVSPVERAHLRFIVRDSAGCEENCRDEKQAEIYYSFHNILASDDAEDVISIDF
jgi:hypothetical protein